jgi:hypothetical protein
MNQFDRPQNTNPEKPDYWTEFDNYFNNDPKLVLGLKMLLLDKKFGKELSKETTIILEFESFTDKLRQIKTAEDVLAFAKEENLEITSEELDELKLELA